jgi:hypothetical protein
VKRRRAFAGIGLSAAFAVVLLAVLPGYATASTGSVAVTAAFPSSSSTVVGSTGFINSTEIGYFWSAARGDSVSQTIHGPSAIRHMILKVDVVTNVLTAGNEVDWNIVINNVVVGQFKVVAGETGLVRFRAHFGKIHGPNYNVVLKVTNEVPSGGGSHSLAYAGAYPHSIQLLKT